MSLIPTLLLALLLGLGLGGSLHADSPKLPRDYAVVSTDGAFTLVVFITGDHGVVDPDLRKRFAGAGVYDKAGKLVSRLAQHMWGGFVTNHGVAFGYGPWAPLGVEDLAGYIVCADHVTTPFPVNSYIKDVAALPRTVSHYRSLYTISYDPVRSVVVIVTLEGKAIVHDAKTGAQVDITKEW